VHHAEIEKQLLLSLGDGDKVALILGKDDLLELISALRICRPTDKRLSMTRDLVQLYSVTFGGEP
jgi:hypothetical protein